MCVQLKKRKERKERETILQGHIERLLGGV